MEGERRGLPGLDFDRTIREMKITFDSTRGLLKVGCGWLSRQSLIPSKRVTHGWNWERETTELMPSIIFWERRQSRSPLHSRKSTIEIRLLNQWSCCLAFGWNSYCLFAEFSYCREHCLHWRQERADDDERRNSPFLIWDDENTSHLLLLWVLWQLCFCLLLFTKSKHKQRTLLSQLKIFCSDEKETELKAFSKIEIRLS